MDFPHNSNRTKQLPALWAAAQPAVDNFIYSQILDFHQAQDILQHVAVIAFAKFGEYDASRPFIAWVIGIARNEVLKSRRQHARERHVFDSQLVEQIADAHVDLRDEFDPMREALRDCVRKVDDRGRQLLQLRYDQQLKPAQIGKRLDISTTSVLVSLHRVRAAIKRCIERRLAGDNPP